MIQVTAIYTRYTGKVGFKLEDGQLIFGGEIWLDEKQYLRYNPGDTIIVANDDTQDIINTDKRIERRNKHGF